MQSVRKSGIVQNFSKLSFEEALGIFKGMYRDPMISFDESFLPKAVQELFHISDYVNEIAQNPKATEMDRALAHRTVQDFATALAGQGYYPLAASILHSIPKDMEGDSQRSLFDFDPLSFAALSLEKAEETILKSHRDPNVSFDGEFPRRIADRLSQTSSRVNDVFDKVSSSDNDRILSLKAMAGLAQDCIEQGYYMFGLSMLYFIETKRGHDKIAGLLGKLERQAIQGVSVTGFHAPLVFDFQTVAAMPVEKLAEAIVRSDRNIAPSPFARRKILETASLLWAGCMAFVPADKQRDMLVHSNLSAVGRSNDPSLGLDAARENVRDVYRSGKPATEKQRVVAFQSILNSADALTSLGYYRYALAVLDVARIQVFPRLSNVDEYGVYFDKEIKEREAAWREGKSLEVFRKEHASNQDCGDEPEEGGRHRGGNALKQRFKTAAVGLVVRVSSMAGGLVGVAQEAYRRKYAGDDLAYGNKNRQTSAVRRVFGKGSAFGLLGGRVGRKSMTL